jgi:hypothetical protein
VLESYQPTYGESDKVLARDTMASSLAILRNADTMMHQGLIVFDQHGQRVATL